MGNQRKIIGNVVEGSVHLSACKHIVAYTSLFLNPRRILALAPAPKVLGPKHISTPEFAWKPF